MKRDCKIFTSIETNEDECTREKLQQAGERQGIDRLRKILLILERCEVTLHRTTIDLFCYLHSLSLPLTICPVFIFLFFSFSTFSISLAFFSFLSLHFFPFFTFLASSFPFFYLFLCISLYTSLSLSLSLLNTIALVLSLFQFRSSNLVTLFHPE